MPKLIHLGTDIAFCTGQPSSRLQRTSDATKVTCKRCLKQADSYVKLIELERFAPISAKVIMQFGGHDIEGDAATLSDINNKLTQHAMLLAALRKIAAYPVNVHGYNSVSAVRLRFVAAQTIARAAISALEVQS